MRRQDDLASEFAFEYISQALTTRKPETPERDRTRLDAYQAAAPTPTSRSRPQATARRRRTRPATTVPLI
jgi:hypothetical protein